MSLETYSKPVSCRFENILKESLSGEYTRLCDLLDRHGLPYSIISQHIPEDRETTYSVIVGAQCKSDSQGLKLVGSYPQTLWITFSQFSRLEGVCSVAREELLNFLEDKRYCGGSRGKRKFLYWI